MANTTKALLEKTSKRVQVDKAQSTLFIIVAVASLITVFGLVASKSYFSEAGYLNRVADEKQTALDQLKANKNAVDQLVEKYKDFANKDTNIIAGSKTGTGPRDGDNPRLILDALPSKYDFPALATSIEKLLTGYKINSINGTDDSLNQIAGTTAVEIPFTADVESTYVNIKTLVGYFQNSIRPFQYQSLQLTGVDNGVQSIMKAKTYYQPEKDLTIQTKEIK